MGLEFWYRDDIRNILLSLAASLEASQQWCEDKPPAQYRAGYKAALAATALAFGLPPSAVFCDLSPRTGSTERVNESRIVGLLREARAPKAP